MKIKIICCFLYWITSAIITTDGTNPSKLLKNENGRLPNNAQLLRSVDGRNRIAAYEDSFVENAENAHNELVIRKKRQDTAPAPGGATATGEASAPGTGTVEVSAGTNGDSNGDETTEEAAGAPPEIPDQLRWITNVLLFAVVLLMILLMFVVIFLVYFIFTTKLKSRPICKEYELQCRCEECGKQTDPCAAMDC